MNRLRTVRYVCAVLLMVAVCQIAFPAPTDACGCMDCVERYIANEFLSFCKLENPGWTSCYVDIWGNCGPGVGASFCECITVVA